MQSGSVWWCAMSDDDNDPDRIVLEMLAWGALVVVGVMVLVLIMGYRW